MLVILGWIAAVVLIGVWFLSYGLTRDAEDATEKVAGGLFSIVVGLMTVMVVVVQEAASALSLFGDQLAGQAPYLANLFVIAFGYFVSAGAVVVTPQTWILITIGTLLLFVMYGRRSS